MNSELVTRLEAIQGMPDRIEHQMAVQNRPVSNLLDSTSIEVGQLV